uniref:Uncharacterized protein n=1 Tax=Setaria digitata TaxID=48799 RepID=A0A915Q742_9BILA
MNILSIVQGLSVENLMYAFWKVLTPKFGLMQRLSTWFEQLPIRRRGSASRPENCSSRSHLHKRQSKSAAPRLHYSVSAIQSYHRDHSANVLSQSLVVNDQPHVIMPTSWNRQEAVTNSCCDNSKLTASFLQSFSTPGDSGRKEEWAIK